MRGRCVCRGLRTRRRGIESGVEDGGREFGFFGWRGGGCGGGFGGGRLLGRGGLDGGGGYECIGTELWIWGVREGAWGIGCYNLCL